jgi:uncharacterized protein YxeA
MNAKLQDFSAPSSLGESAGSDFASSNGVVAKFVFLILILIVFVALLNFGIYVMNYWFQPDRSPYLVKGLQQGNRSTTISQDPRNSNSITIYRSNNASKGIEFTWNVWLNLTELPTAESTVFVKGNIGKYGPGVFVNKHATLNTAVLIIKMDDATNATQTVTIPDIPLKRWFNVAIRMQNKIMDVYINGTIAKRYAFDNLPKQNFNDVRICPSHTVSGVTTIGFPGMLSNLRYFDSALNVFQLTNIAMAGPNLTSTETTNDSRFDYLSTNWYAPSPP